MSILQMLNDLDAAERYLSDIKAHSGVYVSPDDIERTVANAVYALRVYRFQVEALLKEAQK